MAEIRWFRVAIAIMIGVAIIVAALYFTAKSDPLNATNSDLMLKGCAVVFAPDGSYEIIPFGDLRCPK